MRHESIKSCKKRSPFPGSTPLSRSPLISTYYPTLSPENSIILHTIGTVSKNISTALAQKNVAVGKIL